MTDEWFKNWFDTKYYHILYKHRNFSEAEHFINKLLDFLAPKKESKFLDIACGKGRHSLYINEKGFQVVGYDLSEQSIRSANSHAKNGVEFYTHDMRQIFRTNYFDFALNLFTSFGYFNTVRDELNAIKSFAANLKPGGKLVIDFLNKHKVISELLALETKRIDNIEFLIRKKIEQQRVVKDIEFQDKGRNYTFQESVKLLGLEDFKNYLQKVDLKITHTFGNYNLDDFNTHSDRLIIIAQKVG